MPESIDQIKPTQVLLEDLPDVPLPTYIDALADRDPDRPVGEVLTTSALGYTSKLVTIGHLANAIDETARWLDEQLGPDGPTVLAFMAPAHDLRYLYFMLGAIKSRRLAFFPSPSNDVQSHCVLFEKYGCDTLLLPKKSPLREQMAPVLDELGVKVITIPGMHFFLSAPPKAYIWTPTDEIDFRLQPLVGLQSSGTTDSPRPVIVRHGCVTAMRNWQQIPDLGFGDIHFTHWSSKTILLGFALSHFTAIGIFIAALQNDFFVVFPPIDSEPLTAARVSSILERTHVDVLIAPPSILADMASSLELLRSFTRVGGVAYGGGPLPETAGDLIAQQCHLLNFVDMSESGILPCELVRQSDWKYFKFSPVLGIEMRPYADGLFELVFVRREEHRAHQVVFFTFPGLEEYSTSDLFSAHPTKPGLWKWQGRTNDIIAYSTGEKFNPIPMEITLSGSPLVTTALVYGNGKPQSALLIEPSAAAPEPSNLLRQIWPLCQRSNLSSATHARISREMVLITDPDKPLPRTGKNTVRRKAAFDLYRDELESVYRGSRQWSAHLRIDPPSDECELDVQRLTQQIIDMVERSTGLSLTERDDFVDAGVDSVGIMSVLRSLRKLVNMHDDTLNLDARAIYEHSTAISLAEYICNVQPRDEEADVTYFMQELYEKYTADLPITARKPLQYPLDRKVVLLTGSTGNLGTYVFDQLARDKTVEHIICINRSDSSKAVQVRALEERGLYLDIHDPADKALTFLTGDFSKQYLGLDAEVYRALLEEVTHVLHTAWNVNFNLPLQHFESPHICGISQLIDFSARSRYGAVLFFVSSTVAVSNYFEGHTTTRIVPEAPVVDWTAAPTDIGYYQSKLVAERIMATAAAEAGIPCVICRVSQLAGPINGEGVWPKHEWLPSLIISSKHMGCLPATLGSHDVVDWLPVDQAAKIVVDFFNNASERLQTGVPGALVYHAVNPRATTWDTLLPVIQPYLGVWNIYPSSTWAGMLAVSEEDLPDKNPATHLLGFFDEMVHAAMLSQMDTSQSVRASHTMSALQPITGESFGKWLRHWV